MDKIISLKYITVFLVLFFGINTIKGQATFSVGSINNNYTLTCNNSVVTLTASSGTTPFSYTWTSPTGTMTGNVAYATSAGTWSVTGKNLITSSSFSHTFLITQNLTTPNVTVTPVNITLTCNIASPVITGVSDLGPSVNTSWFKVYGTNTVYVTSPQGSPNSYYPTSGGLYYFESKHSTSGCATTKSVNVTVTGGIPEFTLSSSPGFSIGCSTASLASLTVNSVITTPSTNTLVNYAFVAPPAIAAPIYGSNNSLNNINTPGLWVVYVKDMTNGCIASHSLNLIQNTTAPVLGYMKPVAMISCFSPSMEMSAYSNSANNVITWTVPAIPSNTIHLNANLTVSINLSVLNATVAYSSLGVFTVDVVDVNNLCKTTNTLQIPQDVRLPSFSVSALSNSILTCNDQNVLLVSITSTAMAAALLPNYLWQTPLSFTSTGSNYNATVAGVYTVASTSAVNGCKYINTYNVLADNSVTAFSQTIGVSCPISTVLVSPDYPNGTGDLLFNWSGAAGTIITPTNLSVAIVNTPGDYICVITNTVNGCTKTVTCSVICSTGVNEFTFNDGIALFPNPSNGIIRIETNSVPLTFFVFDLQGKLLLQSVLNHRLNVLDLKLEKGIYLYRVVKGDVIIKKDKLIIE